MTTPAGPARLAERDLAAIEERYGVVAAVPFGREGFIIEQSLSDVPALVAALRAAWAENARYRAVLEQINRVVTREDPSYSLLKDIQVWIGAALAAPGAGEETTT